MQVELECGDIINEEYTVTRLIAQGSFGRVYKGACGHNRKKVAIKAEKIEMARFSSIAKEVEILQHLHSVPQIPQLLWHGTFKGQAIMIINLLGKDLAHYMEKQGSFSFECICNIAFQMLSILNNIHNRNIIHRDIKPENILGEVNSDKIALIDFGVSKAISQNQQQRDKQLSFIGTSRYASLAAHQGVAQGRKDDLESLGYMLLFLLNRKLPWMKIEEKNNNLRIQIIGQLKQSISLNELCRHTPSQMLKYMTYVRNMQPGTKPNYIMLKSLFINHYTLQVECLFDWNKPSHSQEESHSHSKQIKQRNRIKKGVYKSYFQKKQQIQIFQSRKIKSVKQASPCNTSEENSLQKSEKSLAVRFTHTHAVTQKTKKSMQPIQGLPPSTYDAPNNNHIDYMTCRTEQEIYQYENSDLEYKFKQLHVNSVFQYIIELIIVIIKIQYRFVILY